jgi:hypothetical protein
MGVKNMIDYIGEIIRSFINILPGLILAIIVVLLGWIVSYILSIIFKKILVKGFKIENFLKKHKLHDALGEAKVSNILAKVVFWWIFLVFIGQAANLVYLGTISVLIQRLIEWMPNLLYAILIVLGGFLLADFVNESIKATKIIWSSIIASVLKIVIMVMVLMTAFTQVGVNMSFISDILKIITAGLTLGVAIAFGLAFGLGLKDETPKIIDSIKKELKKTK